MSGCSIVKLFTIPIIFNNNVIKLLQNVTITLLTSFVFEILLCTKIIRIIVLYK